MPKAYLFLAGALISPVVLFARNSDSGYLQTNLVANKAEYHPQIVDENMINAWGIALRPPGAGGHIWVSNARTGTSSEYIGDLHIRQSRLHQRDGLKLVSLGTTLDLPTTATHL